jgi:hypothetical protein
MAEEMTEEKNSLVGLSVGVLVVFLLLVGGVYYYVSKKSKGEVIFPAGVNYLSPENKQTGPTAPSYDYAKMATSSDWLTYKGKAFAFSFQYPKGLSPLTFPNDPNDSVTFNVSTVPPERNLMFVMETISARDKKLVGQPEQFVKSYWKFFSGLKSVKSMAAFTNEKGLNGFKVNYINKANIVGTDNYFFEVPGDSDHLLHINNTFPKEGEAVFLRMLNSLDYKK